MAVINTSKKNCKRISAPRKHAMLQGKQSTEFIKQVFKSYGYGQSICVNGKKLNLTETDKPPKLPLCSQWMSGRVDFQIRNGISEEKYGGGDSGMDIELNKIPRPHTNKADPISDGDVSTLDEEDVCSSPLFSTSATKTTCLQRCTPLTDVPLSPSKALRAACLKSRFADTILKARRELQVLGHEEKGGLGRKDPEENPRTQINGKVAAANSKLRAEADFKRQCKREIDAAKRVMTEAQIRAAEVALQLKPETKLKMQREKEREAARIALENVERTVYLDDHFQTLKDFEMLIGCLLPNQRCHWTGIGTT